MVKCGILDEQLRSDRTALTASRTIWPACRRGCPQTVHLLALSWIGSTLKVSSWRAEDYALHGPHWQWPRRCHDR